MFEIKKEVINRRRRWLDGWLKDSLIAHLISNDMPISRSFKYEIIDYLDKNNVDYEKALDFKANHGWAHSSFRRKNMLDKIKIEDGELNTDDWIESLPIVFRDTGLEAVKYVSSFFNFEDFYEEYHKEIFIEGLAYYFSYKVQTDRPDLMDSWLGNLLKAVPIPAPKVLDMPLWYESNKKTLYALYAKKDIDIKKQLKEDGLVLSSKEYMCGDSHNNLIKDKENVLKLEGSNEL